MAANAAHTTSHPPSERAGATPRAARPGRRSAGRSAAGAVGLLARLTLGGAGAALLLAPAGLAAERLGPWAATPVATGWTAAEAAGAALAGLAALWTVVALLRRPRWAVDAPDLAGADADDRPATLPMHPVAAEPAVTRDEVPKPRPAPRVDDVDPAAVRSSYSASTPAASERAAADDAPATIPFPPAEDRPADSRRWDAAEHAETDEPALIRFEDVPRTVEIGGRVIDLTEMDGAGPKDELLKGLSKKEKRTVRKALRDRERMLMRAA